MTAAILLIIAVVVIAAVVRYVALPGRYDVAAMVLRATAAAGQTRRVRSFGLARIASTR